jgi:drug/metabolite transporter (DMT)-like permease
MRKGGDMNVLKLRYTEMLVKPFKRKDEVKQCSTALLAVILFLTLLSWSSTYSAIRSSLSAYEPNHIALMRYLASSVTMLAMLLWQIRKAPSAGGQMFASFRHVGVATWVMLAFSGLLGISVYNLALCTGELTVTAGTASLLIGTAPVFTALFATLFLGDKLRLLNWLGLFISFAGAAVIALAEGGGFNFVPGVGLIALAAIVQAISIVLQKKTMNVMTPFISTTAIVWLGTAFLMPFFPGLTEAVGKAPLQITLSVIYLGVVPAGLGNVAWAFVLSKADASKVASSLYLVPFMALFVAWITLGEVPTIMALAGGAAVLVGVGLSSFKQKPMAKPLPVITSNVNEICGSLRSCVQSVQPATVSITDRASL